MSLLQAASPEVEKRLRPPLGVILGSPPELTQFFREKNFGDILFYQMDLYPAEKLREELSTNQIRGSVAVAPDLWDLPAGFQTLFYPAPAGGERGLKLDMIEQAYHVLRPGGSLVVWSPYSTDQLFPTALKKLFGRVHAPQTEHG